MSTPNTTWISDWNPEDETFWKSKGKTIAQRNLIWSIVAEHHRVFGLGDMEHRRDQVTAGRLSLHDRPAVSARRAAGLDRCAVAFSVHVCGNDVWRTKLDDLQRVGSVHPDHRARVFRNPAGYAFLGDVAGGRNGRSRRRQFRLEHGQHFVLLPGPDEGLGAGLERSRRQYRCQQRSVAYTDFDGRWAYHSLPGHADRGGRLYPKRRA